MASKEGIPSWDIQTSLNLDTSFDLPGMLSDSGKISLSDIIAATIGESEADSKTSIAVVPDITENSDSCDSNSRQFYSNDSQAKEMNAEPDISELFSENSNACDAFSMESILNDKNQHSLGNTNKTLNCQNVKTEVDTYCDTKEQKLDDVEEAFFSFFDRNFGETKMPMPDQQVVPKLEKTQACDNRESGMTFFLFST